MSPQYDHITNKVAIGLTCAALAACETTTDDPEFANIAPWNIIPKSSPSKISEAFVEICLARTLNEKQQALRRADYIATRDTGRGVSTYVADTRRPAIMLHGETGCAVAAQAQAGQTNRFIDLVADTFPKARRVAPASIGPRVEHAWITNEGDVIWLERHGPKVAPPRVIFAINRPRKSAV